MKKNIEINLIHIQGKTFFGEESPEEYMKDMLRYDRGVIFELKHEEGQREFEATIVASEYTPERWLSFGLCPTLINGTKKAWRTQMNLTQKVDVLIEDVKR